jgi:hypothetical protein
MTPNDLEILIHYYVSPAPHPREEAPAVRESVKMFLTLHVLEVVDYGFRVTEKGQAWLRLILATPLPVCGKRWIDPRTGEDIITT